MMQLTDGAIEALSSGSGVNDAILQLVSIRKIEGGSGPARYRVMMSDGRHTMSSFMLCTQLNFMAEDNQLAPNCIVLIKRHVTNILKDGRRVVIILEIEVLKPAADVKGRIGNPTPYSGGNASCNSKHFDVNSFLHLSQVSQMGVHAGQAKAPQQAAPPPAAPVNRPPLQAQIGNDAPSSASLPPPVNRAVGKDFGKKPAAPTTPGGPSKVVPIASLNPYLSKWTICARITNKSSIRTWSNSRGDGKLFSMEVVDESGEIRVTSFNQEVDKFFGLIEVGKVYYISKGNLKVANKRFTSVKNDYEVTLNGETSIIPCEDNCDVPIVQCDFITIGDLEKKEKDSLVDVIGVCKSVGEVTRLTTKTNREVSKRTINLMDTSGKVVMLTLWGEEAEQFNGTSQPIVAIKGAKLSDFGGVSLSASFTSTLMTNPDIPEAYKLRGWFDKEGHSMEGQSVTELKGSGGIGNGAWKTLADVKAENLGHGEKADYYTCIGTIVYMRQDNCLYRACPSPDCNKKVVDQYNGMYRCEKCDKEFPNFKYRLILAANISDYTNNQWVTCFQETAEAILGQNAAYLGQLKETNEAALDEIFQKANFSTFVFRNRVKLETYNDESRIKATVMEVKPVDHEEYSRRLITNIRKMGPK